jgi:Na+/melibiose symporter-like transporter
MTSTRTGVWPLLGYGSGSMALAAYYLVSGAYLLFATAILGVPADTAGLIMALSTLWDAVIDLPLGWWSDRTRSHRFGRRHGFMAVGGVATAALTIALWATPHGLGPVATALWLGAAMIGLKTAIAAFMISHTALGGEIVDGYDARTVAQGYRAAFQVLGMLFALVGSNLIFFRPTPAFPQGQLNPAAYAPMGLACAALVLLSTATLLAGTWRFVPRLRAPAAAQRIGVRAMLDLLRDRNLRALTLMILCIELTLQIGISLGNHVNTYTYGLSGPQMGLLGLALLGSAALSQPLWIRLGRRWDKKPTLIVAAVVAIAGFTLAPLTHVAWGWFPLAPAGHVVMTLLPFQMLAGAGTGAFWSLPYAMVGDCALDHERRTGESVAGSCTGLYVFAYKVGSSASIAASGWLLQRIGYDATRHVQAEDTRYWLAVAPALLILAGTPVALWALGGYRLVRAGFAAPAQTRPASRTQARPDC